jgi:hypothetical protein
MSLGRFLIGVIELAAIVVPIYLGAISLRRVLFPGWSGAASRLAEIVLLVSGLILVAELVGVVGLYRPGFMIAASVITGGVVIGLCRRHAPSGDPTPLPRPPVTRVVIGLAVAGAVAVTWHWAVRTQFGLEAGMYLPNTTWHNAPFAARFVQEAQIGLLHFTEPLRLSVWFYPQNSELLHSLGILTLGTDVISPAINIGWLVLALLAAWVIGRPYGVGAAALIAVATVFDTTMLLLYEPGDAKNDVMGLFCLLAAIALLVNGEAQRRAASDASAARPRDRFGFGPLLVAALAAGIAAGTRLNMLAPVALLTLAIIYLGFRGERLRTSALWIGGLIVTSSFWYLRNLITSGNPFPWAKSIGPIDLPHPDQVPIDVREPGVVAKYITDLPVIREIFLPAIRDNLGDLWVLVIAAAVIFTIVAIFNGPTRTIRTLGVVAVLSFVAYLFTPLTAAGDSGRVSGFAVNMRYVAPAMVIAMAIGPLSPLFQKSRTRRRVLLGVLLVTLLFTLWPSAPVLGGIAASAAVWSEGYTLPALAFALVLVVVPVVLAYLWRQPSMRLLAVTASVIVGLGVFLVSYLKTDGYVESRYDPDIAKASGDVPQDIVPLIRWARPLTDQRIGIVGTSAAFKQYFLYGKDLSNRVYYVGEPSANGGYRPILNCRDFRRRVNQLEIDYLVTAPYHDVGLRIPAIARLNEAEWAVGLPQTRVVFTQRGFTVFEVDGRLDPGTCEV